MAFEKNLILPIIALILTAGILFAIAPEQP
jgi:hypothetical protein